LYLGTVAANPNAVTGIDYTGQFSGPAPTKGVWDMGLKNYSPNYWNAAAIHVYPITTPKLTVLETQKELNAVLAWGTTVNLQSYLIPLLGDTPIFISEINDGHSANKEFKSSLYNGIYLAEYTARMSTSPQVKAIGMANLFEGNNGNSSAIRTPDDHNKYLVDQVKKNPNYSTDTATNPKTQFSFYYSAPGLAMQVVNPAINGSTGIWPTTVTGGPTVPITGFGGQPIPAVFAQAYDGNDGTHYVVITNKSRDTVPVAIEVNGTLLEQTLSVTYVSSPDPTAQNTAGDQNHVQAVTDSTMNPIMVGPYCVMRVQW
jgi:hypothetical protein